MGIRRFGSISVRSGAIIAVMSLSACIPLYNYEITDPASGAKYYTRDMLPGEPHRSRYDTTITFHDARDGKAVTLPSAQVRELSDREFKDATARPTAR